MQGKSIQQHRKSGRYSFVEQIICYIDAHLLEDLSATTLSKIFFVSKSNLDCVFKKCQGCTLHTYVMAKRLIWARQKIIEGTPAGEASYLCGFKEYSTFYRQYKKKFGISPKLDIKSSKR